MKKLTVLIFVFVIAVLAVSAQQTNVMYSGMSWSPDGKYLSFTRMESTNTQPRKMTTDIYVIKPDGSGMKKITNGEMNKFNPSWSKNGRKIFFGGFLTGSTDGEIYSTKIDGTGLKQITMKYGRSSAPSVSPDGKWIVFNSETVAHKPQIAVMNIGGKGIKALTNDNTIAFYNPIWSPDGKMIVYYVERGDQKDQIWTMNADGTGKTLLTNNIAHNFYPSWSSDGKRIIYCSDRDGEKNVIYSIKLDGTDIKRQMKPNSFYARISPDGKTVAFIAGAYPTTSILVANVDGTGETKITP